MCVLKDFYVFFCLFVSLGLFFLGGGGGGGGLDLEQIKITIVTRGSNPEILRPFLLVFMHSITKGLLFIRMTLGH